MTPSPPVMMMMGGDGHCYPPSPQQPTLQQTFQQQQQCWDLNYNCYGYYDSMNGGNPFVDMSVEATAESAAAAMSCSEANRLFEEVMSEGNKSSSNHQGEVSQFLRQQEVPRSWFPNQNEAEYSNYNTGYATSESSYHSASPEYHHHYNHQVHQPAARQPGGEGEEDVAILTELVSPTTNEVVETNIPDITILEQAKTDKKTTTKKATSRPRRRRQRCNNTAATSIRYGLPSGVVKCPVCVDGESGSHTYYGGKVCHSCRGFFRRSVQNGHHPYFSCKRDGRCRVESKTRKSCKWCRFNRCLKEAGLKIELVLSAQQREHLELKKTQNRLAKSKKKEEPKSVSSNDDETVNVEDSSDSLGSPSSAKSLVPMVGGEGNRSISAGFGKEDLEQFMRLYKKLHASNHVKRFQFLASDLSRLDKFLGMGLSESVSLSRSFLTEMNLMDEMATKNFALSEVRQMGELSPYDRMALVQANFDKVNGFQLAWAYSNTDFPVYFRDLFEHGRRHRRQSLDTDAVMSLLGERADKDDDRITAEEVLEAAKKNNGRKGDAALSRAYDDDDGGDEEQETLHADIMKWVRPTPDSTTDLVLNILLSLVVLFDAGGAADQGVRLESPDKVQKLQDNFLRILHRYLQATYPQDGELRFQENLKNSTVRFRRFYQIHKRRTERSQQ